MSSEGRRKLELAYDGLEHEAPDRVARVIHWLRNPEARRVRLPLGILLILVGFAGIFLPLIGLELVPIGLILIAQDLPAMQEPVADFTLWLERQWVLLRCWWQARRGQR